MSVVDSGCSAGRAVSSLFSARWWERFAPQWPWPARCGLQSPRSAWHGQNQEPGTIRQCPVGTVPVDSFSVTLFAILGQCLRCLCCLHSYQRLQCNVFNTLLCLATIETTLEFESLCIHCASPHVMFLWQIDRRDN